MISGNGGYGGLDTVSGGSLEAGIREVAEPPATIEDVDLLTDGGSRLA